MTEDRIADLIADLKVSLGARIAELSARISDLEDRLTELKVDSPFLKREEAGVYLRCSSWQITRLINEGAIKPRYPSSTRPLFAKAHLNEFVLNSPTNPEVKRGRKPSYAN